MTKRGSSPALYELFHGRNRPPVAPRRKRQPPRPPAAVEHVARWLKAGRAVRLPVGYLIAAGVMVAAGIATAYVIGSRGSDSADGVAGDTNLMQLARHGEQSPRAVDPLVALPEARRQADPPAARTEPPAAPAPPANGWGPVFSDPRQAGLSYFVLAETTAAGAERLADYCRSQGLETYVVGRKRNRFRRVIALPGFAPSVRSSPEVKSLEAHIRRIGDGWKHQESGATDLRDAYPSLFGG